MKMRNLFKSKWNSIKPTGYGCLWCNQKFTNETEAQQHWNTHLHYTCTGCGKCHDSEIAARACIALHIGEEK